MARSRISAILLLIALCGCGGGVPNSATQLSNAISPAGGSFKLPAVSTYSGTLTYPANNAPGGATLAISSTTQTGTPLAPGWSFLWQNNPLVSFIFVPSATVTFDNNLTLTVDMGSNMPPLTKGAGNLELDASGFDVTAQTEYFEDAAFAQNVSGTTVTFSLHALTDSPSLTGPLLFTAGHKYQVVLNPSWPAP
jgi:hypothetical protein